MKLLYRSDLNQLPYIVAIGLALGASFGVIVRGIGTLAGA